MPAYQMELPGFGGNGDNSLPFLVKTFVLHMTLRGELVQLFDNEIALLRTMGTMNDAQCSQEVFQGQREVVMALKNLIVAIDLAQDTIAVKEVENGN